MAYAALLPGLCLAACGGRDPDPDPRSAAAAARAMQHMIGHSAGPITIVSIEAEDKEGEDVLVVTFDGAAGWRRGTPSYALTAPFLQGFCTEPLSKNYFGEGRALRLDTLEDHENLIRGAPVHRCPTP